MPEFTNSLSEKERKRLKETLTPDTRNEAIQLVREWTWDRLVEWDDAARPVIAQILIDGVNKFGVSPPEFWYKIVSEPSEFDEMHEDLQDDTFVYVDPGDDDFDIRPTEHMEEEVLHTLQEMEEDTISLPDTAEPSRGKNRYFPPEL